MSVRFRDPPAYAPAPPATNPVEPPPSRHPALLLMLLTLFDMPQGWLAVAGFALAAEAVAGSVRAANWQPGLGGLPWLVAVALVTALVVSKTPTPRLRWHTLAVIIGCLLSIQMLARFFLPAGLGLVSQTGTVLNRLVDWIDQSIMVRIYQDNFLVALGVAVYLFVWVYAAYWVGIRWRMGWIASAMLGLAILGNVEFDRFTAEPYLALWAAGCLLMNLQLGLIRQRAQRQVRFSGWRSRQRVALTSGLVVVALGSAAFAFTPNMGTNGLLNALWRHVDGPIVRAQQIYDNLGVERTFDPSEIRGPNFGSALPFLGPFRPGNQPVMNVRSDSPRFQQGVVFNRYSHAGWTSTFFDQFQRGPNAFVTATGANQTAHDRDRQRVSEQVTALRPKGALLFAAPQPVGASLPLQGDGLGDLRATSVPLPGQTYTSTSLESTASTDALLAASGSIPQAISSVYLQLPSDMPARVKALAQREVRGASSEYDKATAIESYLRAIPYDTEIPPPPQGRDGVDWFLFDEKKGYADYSASAMAVLLRSVGIPARVVAGYSPGTFNTTDGTFHITEAQTATWTQVYFPGYGWIDFQPSSNSPLAGRGSGAAGGRVSTQASAAGQPDPSLPPRPPKPVVQPKVKQAPRHFPWGIFWIIPAALIVLAFALSSRGQRASARLAYARLVLLGRLLGIRPRRWQTPREFGRELVQRRGLHLQHTETVTSLYTAARYRSGPLPAADHRRAWRSWQVIRKQFALFWQRWL